MDKKIILFDIDGTLADKSKTKKNIVNFLLNYSTKTAEEIEMMMENFLDKSDNSKDFLIGSFIKSLTGDKNFKEFDINNPKIYDGILFEDTLPVLEKFKEKNQIMGTYTQGYVDFQKAKIKFTGIEKFFDKDLIYVSPDKLELNFVKTLPNSAVVIDDKKRIIETLRQLRPDLELVWINRNDEEKMEGVRTIKSLEELV
jgi:FMN phosphatase YigB (HAD superfamily)